MTVPATRSQQRNSRSPRVVADLVRDLEQHALIAPVSARWFAPVLRDYANGNWRGVVRVPLQVWLDLELLEEMASDQRRSERVVAAVVATTAESWSPDSVEGDDGREVTVTQAAELLGVNREVIARRCDREKLSYRQDEHGVRWIRTESLGCGE